MERFNHSRMSREDWIMSGTPTIVDYNHHSQVIQTEPINQPPALTPSDSYNLNDLVQLQLQMLNKNQSLSSTNIFEGSKPQQFTSFGPQKSEQDNYMSNNKNNLFVQDITTDTSYIMNKQSSIPVGEHNRLIRAKKKAEGTWVSKKARKRAKYKVKKRFNGIQSSANIGTVTGTSPVWGDSTLELRNRVDSSKPNQPSRWDSLPGQVRPAATSGAMIFNKLNFNEQLTYSKMSIAPVTFPKASLKLELRHEVESSKPRQPSRWDSLPGQVRPAATSGAMIFNKPNFNEQLTHSKMAIAPVTFPKASLKLELKHKVESSKPKQPSRWDSLPGQVRPAATSGAMIVKKPYFKEQLTHRKMAIAPLTFPEARFTKKECILLQEKLVNLMLSDENATVPLQILKTYHEKGALVVTCGNDETITWLLRAPLGLDSRGLDGAGAIVVDYKDLLQHTIKALLHTDKFMAKMEANQILLQVEKQNPGLSTKDWRVVSCKREEDHQTLVLAIDERNALALRDQDWRIYLGIRRVQLKLLTRWERQH